MEKPHVNHDISSKPGVIVQYHQYTAIYSHHIRRYAPLSLCYYGVSLNDLTHYTRGWPVHVHKATLCEWVPNLRSLKPLLRTTLLLYYTTIYYTVTLLLRYTWNTPYYCMTLLLL